MNQFGQVLAKAVFIVVVVVVFGLILSWPVMMLWNYCLVGAIAGVAKIEWLQAWGIMVLCGFLFKSTKSD